MYIVSVKHVLRKVLLSVTEWDLASKNDILIRIFVPRLCLVSPVVASGSIAKTYYFQNSSVPE